MSWTALEPSRIALLDRGDEPARLLDPYAAWACLTQFRGFVLEPVAGDPPLAERVVDVLAELDDPSKRPRYRSPPAYLQPLGGQPARHVTLSLKVGELADLWRDPLVRRWELGTALTPGAALAPADSALESVEPGGGPPLLAVIDHGCAFIHRQFRRASGSRVARLWDQGQPRRATPWRVPALFGYGRELDRTAIDRLLSDYLAGPSRDEALVYTDHGYLVFNDQPSGEPYFGTHGTHVCDLAAGQVHPLTEEEDAASAADLLFVHLPLATVLDSTGGSLGPKVLDGLRYLLAAAGPRGLVVNLSYGTQAGPHDGSSLIESALDELLQLRKQDFAVVLGAGNSRRQKAHAAVALYEDSTESLVVDLPDEDKNDSFVEIWYPRPADPKHAPLVAVAAPGEPPGPPVPPGRHQQLPGAGGEPVAALFHFAAVPNGQHSMVLLALAGSRQPERAAPAGKWRIRLSLPGGAPTLPVHAWVERDDLPRHGSASPIAFTGQTPVAEEQTLASLATGSHTLVVGAAYLNSGRQTDYSSLGPTTDYAWPPSTGTAREQPQVLGPAEENAALGGLRAAGVRSGDTFRMGGTSVAAPLVARALYGDLVEQGHIGRDGWSAALDRVIASPHGRALKIGRPPKPTDPPD